MSTKTKTIQETPAVAVAPKVVDMDAERNDTDSDVPSNEAPATPKPKEINNKRKKKKKSAKKKSKSTKKKSKRKSKKSKPKIKPLPKISAKSHLTSSKTAKLVARLECRQKRAEERLQREYAKLDAKKAKFKAKKERQAVKVQQRREQSVMRIQARKEKKARNKAERNALIVERRAQANLTRQLKKEQKQEQRKASKAAKKEEAAARKRKRRARDLRGVSSPQRMALKAIKRLKVPVIKKPTTAWAFFLKTVMAEKRPEHSGMLLGTIGTNVRGEWEVMPAEQMQVYSDMAAADKTRYKNQLFNLTQEEKLLMKKLKRVRSQKKKNSPKAPLTPFMIFFKATRPSIVAANHSAGFGQVGKLIGEQWRNTSEEDRAPHVQAAAKDRERYQSEMEKYTTKLSDQYQADIKRKEEEAKVAKVHVALRRAMRIVKAKRNRDVQIERAIRRREANRVHHAKDGKRQAPVTIPGAYMIDLTNVHDLTKAAVRLYLTSNGTPTEGAEKMPALPKARRADDPEVEGWVASVLKLVGVEGGEQQEEEKAPQDAEPMVAQ